MQLFQHCGGGAEQHGVARQHSGMTDILGDHGLAQAVAADQHEVASFGDKVQRQSPLDHVAFDLTGPGPIKIGHGLESLNSGKPQTAFQAATGAVGDFSLD